MSDAAPHDARPGDPRPVRIGVLRLTDSLPVLLAAQRARRRNDLLLDLTIEPSWANLADKLAFGMLDAAAMLHPLALAMAMGLRGPPSDIVVPMGLSRGGNSIVLTPSAAECAQEASLDARAARLVGWLRAQPGRPRLACVHLFSSHHLLLRELLARGGGDAERDAEIVALPPQQVVAELASGHIAGFCAGAPWGDIAQTTGAGTILAGSTELWPDHTEKCLVLRGAWAAEAPDACRALLAALRASCAACGWAEDPAALVGLLRGAGLDGPEAALRAALPGGAGRAPVHFDSDPAAHPPARDGEWLLAQMARWDMLPAGIDRSGLLDRIYAASLGSP